MSVFEPLNVSFSSLFALSSPSDLDGGLVGAFEGEVFGILIFQGP